MERWLVFAGHEGLSVPAPNIFAVLDLGGEHHAIEVVEVLSNLQHRFTLNTTERSTSDALEAGSHRNRSVLELGGSLELSLVIRLHVFAFFR
jgi:hypothetical protein